MRSPELQQLTDKHKVAEIAFVNATLALGDYCVAILKGIFDYPLESSMVEGYEIVITLFDVPGDCIKDVKRRVRQMIMDAESGIRLWVNVRVWSHEETEDLRPDMLKGASK